MGACVAKDERKRMVRSGELAKDRCIHVKEKGTCGDGEFRQYCFWKTQESPQGTCVAKDERKRMVRDGELAKDRCIHVKEKGTCGDGEFQQYCFWKTQESPQDTREPATRETTRVSTTTKTS